MLMMILLAPVALQAAEPVGRLQLTCRGGGSANRERSSSVYATDSGGHSAWANARSDGSEQFEDQVDLSIDGNEGRIRLPRTMLPPIRGGEDGWFKLTSIEIGEATITASASVNPLNHPKIHVDRHTGVISIDGKAGHYVGQCERYSPETQPRRF